MTKAFVSSLLAIALSVSARAAPAPHAAPEFVIHTQGNTQLLLSSYRGKTVVLALMFTTCSHCQNVAQLLSEVQKDYAGRGVQVLGAAFDQDAPTRYIMFANVFAKGFPCGYSSSDAVLTFLHQPKTKPPFVPILVFIDKTGTIRKTHMITDDTPVNDVVEHKFFDNPDKGIRAELDALLKGPQAPAAAPKK